MSTFGNTNDIVAEGFVLVRSPLLPMVEWWRWTRGAADPSLSDSDRTDSLTDRLTASFLDGLFLASPSFSDHLSRSLVSASEKKRRAAGAALATFYCRASTRCTPLGAFAGISLGEVAARTDLRFLPTSASRKRFAVDLRWVIACCRWLERQPEVRERLRYSPNHTLWRSDTKFRFLEEFRKERYKEHRWFRIATVDATSYLDHVLHGAKAAATRKELAESLARFASCTPAETTPFIDELIAEQVLVSELQPPLTGIDPARWLVNRMASLGQQQSAHDLERILEEVDQPPFSLLGTTSDSYRRMESRLNQLAPDVEFSGKSFFFANLWKPVAQCTLGGNVVSDVRRALTLLRRITVRPDDRLRRFRQAFHDRYEAREVPLLEALDEETGVPTAGPLDRPPAELNGVIPRHADSTAIDWSNRDQQLLEWTVEIIQRGETELRLERRDLTRLEAEDPGPLLPSFYVYVALGAASAGHVDRGDYRFAVWGYMPTGSLGRFAQDEPDLAERLGTIARREAALYSERGAILAEVCHYPAGQELNNILTRPRFLDYEIVIGCGSESPGERVIRPDELTVSVEGGTVFLHCPRLGREVIPRMHTAHRFDGNLNLRMYRFLNEVARQHLRGAPSWSWGSLDRLPFLPRVVVGRTILAPARWRVRREDLYPNIENELDRLQAVEAFRRKARLPRFVVLAQSDLRLPLDFDNVMSVRGLVRQAQPWEYVEFEELFPAPEESWAEGPEGAYAAEWVVPFRSEPIEPVHPLPSTRVRHRQRRSFPPGSEWVYAKLYVAPPLQNEILQTHVHDLVRALEGAALVDRWFFIRYQDPHTHLRLRFHAVPSGEGELARLVKKRMAALVDSGACWRLQFDTYEREIERYGGDDGIVAAEEAFYHDSEAVLELLREPREVRPDRHWLLAAAGIDSLLTSLNFDDDRKGNLMLERRDSFRKEFRTSANESRRAGDLFRKVRGDVLGIVRKARQGHLKSLDRRSEAIRRILGDRAISNQFAADLCHLHCNRLLRSTQRMQELVIYDLMNRAYDAIRHESIEDAE